MHATEINTRAIIIGVFAALVAAIILNLLGAGVGLASASNDLDAANVWSAFGVWAVSGIIAAFIGGRFAGMIAAGTQSPGLHGLAAWAISTVLVVAAAGFAASTGGAAMLAGPAYMADPSDDMRDAMGALALASAIALIIGAIVAYLGARTAARGALRHGHDDPGMTSTHARPAL